MLAVTGGLAAPALIAGLGVAGAAAAGAGLGAGAAGFAASVAAFGGLSAALGISFGAAGAGMQARTPTHARTRTHARAYHTHSCSRSSIAGLAGYKLNRRTGDVKEFEFELVDCSPGLPVTIGVHGWLNDDTDSPWKAWNEPMMADGNDGGESVIFLRYCVCWWCGADDVSVRVVSMSMSMFA